MGGNPITGFGGGGAGGTGDKLTGGQKSANKSNKKNLADIRALFEGLNLYGDQKYGEALKSIEGVGKSAKTSALSQQNQYLASSKQNLGGLYNSTVANSAARGIHSDTLRTLGGIDEDIARMRAGLLTGQAGFRANSTFNLGSILGGTQHTGGTNYLMELMKIGAAGGMFSDRRVKDIIARIDIVAAADGIPFGVYRWTYKQYPEAGVFEGVVAQEVTHLPNVVFESVLGVLIVDADELKRQTGVEVKSLGVEVAS